MQRAERDPVAAQARGELGGEGGEAFLEARLLEQRRHLLERHFQAQALGLLGIFVPAQQKLEPARAPLQAAHGGL